MYGRLICIRKVASLIWFTWQLYYVVPYTKVVHEVNNAVKNILEEERNRASGRKRKYTHFIPEARARIAKYIQCLVWKHSSSEALCQEVSNSRDHTTC